MALTNTQALDLATKLVAIRAAEVNLATLSPNSTTTQRITAASILVVAEKNYAAVLTSLKALV